MAASRAVLALVAVLQRPALGLHGLALAPGPARSPATDGAAASALPSDAQAALKAMRASPRNLTAQIWGCETLTTAMPFTFEQFQTRTIPQDKQYQFVEAGADATMIAAMRAFPFVDKLQCVCMEAFSKIAQWNGPVALAMGDHGAVEVIADALAAFPDDPNVLGQVSSIAVLTDGDTEASRKNLQRVEKTNITQAVIKGLQHLAKEERKRVARPEYLNNYFGEVPWFRDEAPWVNGYRFLSNACARDALRAQLVEDKYLEFSVGQLGWESDNTMRERFGGIPTPGVIIWSFLRCFMDVPEYRQRLINAGVATQVTRALRKTRETGMLLDLISNDELHSNALDLIAKFAEGNATHKEAFLRAGVVDEIRPIGGDGPSPPKGACKALAALDQGHALRGC